VLEDLESNHLIINDVEEDLPDAFEDSEEEVDYRTPDEEEDSDAPKDIKDLFTMFKDDFIMQKKADKEEFSRQFKLITDNANKQVADLQKNLE
jgi:hypothetical protein